MKLYELSGQYLELQDLEDIPEEALQDTLNALEGQFKEKAMNILHVIANSNGSIEAIDTEIKRLQEKKKRLVNAETRLKDYLRENMEATGITKITSDLFNVTLIKPRDMVVIDDEDQIDMEYMRVSYAPDKTKIKEALKDGAEVAGAHMGLSKAGVKIS